jgi:hypothetical protein
MPAEPDETYSNIRQILGELIGSRVVDITQHDAQEWAETKKSYFMLMFDNGCYLKCFIGDDGFEHNCEKEDTSK